MRRLLIVSSWLLGLAGFLVLAYAFDSLSRRTAQVDGEDVALWIFNPHVAPGETLRGAVGAWKGFALGIRAARIRVGEEVVTVRGRGRHWGSSLTTKSTTRGSDEIDFAIPLADDLPVGAPIEVHVDVDYAYAGRAVGGFSRSSGTEALVVELPIRGPVARIALRIWSAARALLGVALLLLLYLRFGPRLARDESRLSEDETEGLAYLMICVAVFIGIGGYPLFAQPLMAATGWTADGFVVGAMIVWILGPPLGAWQIHKRRPPTATWRLRFADPTGRTDPASAVRGLRFTDRSVRMGRRGFTVRADRRRFVRVALADAGRLEAGATAEASDQALLFELALAIVERAGPMTLVSDMIELVIDRNTTREALDADYAAQAQVVIDRMLAQMREMRDALGPLDFGPDH